jgi:transposase
MKQFINYVGLEVHKEAISVAVADSYGGEVRYFGEIGNTPQSVKKRVESMASETN